MQSIFAHINQKAASFVPSTHREQQQQQQLMAKGQATSAAGSARRDAGRQFWEQTAELFQRIPAIHTSYGHLMLLQDLDTKELNN